MLKLRSKRLFALVVAILLYAAPIMAQRRATSPRKSPPPASPAPSQTAEPVPTFDTLLPADNYRLYSEVRNVGQLVRSSDLNDLLNPLMKLAGPPKEFRTVLKWLNAHADALTGSRMFAASWPSNPKMPAVLMAIEFATPEEAQKFDQELRRFVPALMPKPSPEPGEPKNAAVAQTPAASQRLPYHIKQAGALVTISERPFTFRSLAPRGSKPLAEDPNFAAARNRFASESIFLYVDLKSIEKEERERQQKYQEEEQRRIENEAANPTKPAELPAGMTSATVQPPAEGEAPIAISRQDPGSFEVKVDDSPGTLQSAATTHQESQEMSAVMPSLNSILFGGPQKWPEAIGIAIAFESDSYVVRALILNGDENKPNAIPFIPQFVSGPPLLPASPNIFPSDTGLFVSASLDYPQIYEGTMKAFANAQDLARKVQGQRLSTTEAAANRQPESPLAIYEKKLGIKIKEDLLPLLGNELALALPAKPSSGAAGPFSNPNTEPAATDPKPVNARTSDPSPVIAISVKDREAVRKLIPKIIESFGLKGANLFAQTEKRDDTEITTYANVLSYAFVGDFLVVSPDPVATKHLVDSYLSNQTLASVSHFRNFTRWQPRQVLGQVYVAPDLMQSYTAMFTTGAPLNDKALELLNGVNPVLEPVTYALSNEGSGPLHELHIPKNLLLFMIAGMSRQASEPQPAANEAVAKALLRTVMSAEATYQSTEGNGRFGTLDELISAGLLNKDVLEKYGYQIEVAASGNKFEATAVPFEYSQTARMSYFIDESGVLRGGDHGGGPATVSDNPVD